MGWRDFFKVNKQSFTLFVIFATFANFGILRVSAMFGKSVEASPFDIFSFFVDLNCTNGTSSSSNLFFILCSIWDPVLVLLVFLLNTFWQLFFANLVIILYYKFIK